MSQSITLADLLPQMETAATRMSVKNPARRLLWIAAQVIIQQAQALQQWRDQAEARRIVLPGEITPSVEAESVRGVAID